MSNPHVIDDFESGLRVLNAGWCCDFRYHWRHCDECECEPGSQAVVTSQAWEGSNSLELTVDGSPDTIYAEKQQLVQGTPDWWDWFRNQTIEGSGNWDFQTYDQLIFYMLMPAGITSRHGNTTDWDYAQVFGTYLRDSGTSNTLQEAPDTDAGGCIGHHYYHWFNPRTPESAGTWIKYVVHTVPDLQRDISPGTEHGDINLKIFNQYGDNWWMYDAMTRFYFADMQPPNGAPSSWPADFYADYFYVEQNPWRATELNAYAEVRNWCGYYDAPTNTLFMSWRSRHTASTLTHNIRYAFSDIHTLGWSNATSLGSVTSSGVAGFNSMQLATTSVTGVAGNPTLFIGIEENSGASGTFRQFTLATGETASGGDLLALFLR